MSAHKQFVVSSILLFLDQLIPAAGNWLFWLIIPAFTTPSEVGNATIVYSVVFLVGLITQLGLEYPLLQNSSTHRSKILCTGLIIQLPIVLASVPVIIYLLNNIQEQALEGFTWLAVGILVLAPISFVSRYVLLGISDTKNILIIDSISTGTRFFGGYFLVATLGYGAVGILLSYFVFTVLTAVIPLVLAKSKLGFGSACMKLTKEVFKQGLINAPSKLSKTIIFSLSVVLLSSYGVQTSDIGIFYIALMISLVGGSFVSSMAFMFIPTSLISEKDLFTESVRIGISLTAPIVAALITAPNFILSIIGSDYLSGTTVLILLSLGILPFSIVVNAISYFNHLRQARKLLLIGSVEILAFMISFSYLVPIYQIEGAALSILLAFTVSSMPSLVWLGWRSVKYIANSGIAIAVGWLSGYSLSFLIGRSDIVGLFLSFTASMIMSFLFVMVLRNISFAEITTLLKMSVKRNVGDPM
jgi:O-antigen/teichoic acid export membrane protein